ncbi:MAG: hypothetical protein JWQ49_1321 [Edaphobacter sp.]|nr:hypothetical protein [Edaphobacter sp.]
MFADCIFIRGISLGALASSLLVAQDVAPPRPANTYHVPTSGPVALVSPELHVVLSLQVDTVLGLRTAFFRKVF